MKEIEGIILKLGTEDLNGHVFSKDCKIDYPEKIPITIGYNFDKPGCVVGNAKVIRKDDTISIQGEIMDDTIDTPIEKEIYTNLGFFANKVNKKGNNVTEMFIRSVALLTEKEAALDYCKIIKKENNMSFILEHGNTYKVTTCEKCEAKIGYTKKDITCVNTMDVNWEPIPIDVIRCPECNQYTEVNIISNMLSRGLTPTKEELEKFKDK